MVALLFCCIFLRSQLFLYTLQESIAVMHDECMISIHYMHDNNCIIEHTMYYDHVSSISQWMN